MRGGAALQELSLAAREGAGRLTGAAKVVLRPGKGAPLWTVWHRHTSGAPASSGQGHPSLSGSPVAELAGGGCSPSHGRCTGGVPEGAPCSGSSPQAENDPLSARSSHSVGLRGARGVLGAFPPAEGPLPARADAPLRWQRSHCDLQTTARSQPVPHHGSQPGSVSKHQDLWCWGTPFVHRQPTWGSIRHQSLLAPSHHLNGTNAPLHSPFREIPRGAQPVCQHGPSPAHHLQLSAALHSCLREPPFASRHNPPPLTTFCRPLSASGAPRDTPRPPLRGFSPSHARAPRGPPRDAPTGVSGLFEEEEGEDIGEELVPVEEIEVKGMRKPGGGKKGGPGRGDGGKGGGREGREKGKAGEEKDNQPRLNRAILAPQIRLVTDEGHEILSRAEALKRAHQMGLDLMEVNSRADPPVCRLVDYRRFTFEQRKKEKELRRKQVEKRRMEEIKDVRISTRTERRDLEMKAEMAERHLQRGHRVKCTLIYTGSEKRLGIEDPRFQEMLTLLRKSAKIEIEPRDEGHKIWCLVRPLASPAEGGGA